MTDDLAHRAIQQSLFTVCAEPPSLLHLAGELDLVGAPGLTDALEPLTSRGANIGVELAQLTFMDSTGINALCLAAHALGERGRIVVLNAAPSVRRVIGIAGIVGIIDLPTTAHRLTAWSDRPPSTRHPGPTPAPMARWRCIAEGSVGDAGSAPIRRRRASSGLPWTSAGHDEDPLRRPVHGNVRPVAGRACRFQPHDDERATRRCRHAELPGSVRRCIHRLPAEFRSCRPSTGRHTWPAGQAVTLAFRDRQRRDDGLGHSSLAAIACVSGGRPRCLGGGGR
jgi:anti-anti-sigma factor